MVSHTNYIFYRCSTTTATETESNKSDQVLMIAGSAVAGLLVLLITAASVWCWRAGKCCCRGDSEVVEANEMYGQEEYYDYYEKEDQGSKVKDYNDCYGEDTYYDSD